MTTLRHTVLAIAIAASSFGAFSQTAAEHTQHHPAEPTKKASKASTVKPPSMAKESRAAMDSQMKTMREMHEKMMAAKTPEERSAIMAENMKAMQSGMSMMRDAGMMGMPMKDGMPMMEGMHMQHQMMQKRMEMMTNMMQMMMDQMSNPKSK